MNRIQKAEKKMKINIGISEEHREAIANELSKVLADSYMLYLKTHNYHWNVTGELFHSLHEQFEEQYTELAEAIDEIAERIRSLGYRAPGTFKEFNELTSIEEDTEEPEALEMVRRLALGNEQVLRTARHALQPANDGEDEATVDLLTQRLDVHSKTAWMLRSHLE
ncbi:starvation-inducible DNA-binding protein [Fodinibius roseus]|uniref:Starvation-inducible DNA-binding protein n=2 Tax=Fodinibius roseus TaxID=1194090 RepID=A0A1M5IEX6_9BACT|nr:Dps family protein [Fodinibius roseus]SHG26480.1 starvation-inducible DNA-binding protein [Fodinibius roseus]